MFSAPRGWGSAAENRSVGVLVSLRAATPRPPALLAKRLPLAAARVAPRPSRPPSDLPQQRESTATVGFILGVALWMVLSIARPLDTGPALFWTWFLLGSFLPAAGFLTAIAIRLRGLLDVRVSQLVIVAVVGGTLARGLSVSGRQLATTVLPQFDHGFGGLFADIALNQGALVLVSLAILALLHRGRITVRTAMFVAGGIGAVFSSLHLMTEQFAGIAGGADSAALSVHFLEHATLLTVGYPLWTSLLVGGIVRWRRESTTAVLNQAARSALLVLAGQVATVLLVEVVPSMLGGMGTQIVCLALAGLVGIALARPWRSLISSAEDGLTERPTVTAGRSRQSLPGYAVDQSGGA